MAPQEGRESDPRQDLVRAAASDILEGFYDAAASNQEAAPTPGGQPPNSSEDSKELREKIKQQLEAAKTATKEATVHQELQNTVDSCLRQMGELSDTESIVGDLEFEYKTIDGRSDKCRVARADTVGQLRALISRRTGQPQSDLLLNGAPVSSVDEQTVYHLSTRRNFARRNRPYTLQQVNRCVSG